MDLIKCYNSSDTNNYVESYDITNTADLDVTLTLENSRFSYTVASSGCTTTAYGDYITNFNGTAKSVVDLVNINSGSTCDIPVNFSGNGGPGTTGTIKFALLPTHASNLFWELTNTSLTRLNLDFFTDFEGSDEALFCNEGCTCVGEFNKS